MQRPKITLVHMGLPDEVERKALFAASWTYRPPVFSPFFLEEEEGNGLTVRVSGLSDGEEDGKGLG